MKRVRLSLLVWALALLGACATTGLSSAGRGVSQVATRPDERCVSLGSVVGSSGGPFRSHGVSSAINDATNKAAKLGATHVQLMHPVYTERDGTSNGVVVTGIALRCPAGVMPDGAKAIARAD